MSDSDMTNSCSSCGSSSSCGDSDCSTCGGCSTDANQHSTITLTMEDDTLDEEGQNHDGEVYLYSFTRTAEGAPMLSNIESDEEYNKAAIAFDTVLQNAREAEAAGAPLE